MMNVPRKDTGPGPHILVVEDEVNLATGIQFSLEHENYTVTLVHDGAEARDLILKRPECFDVIVLDIMLPGCNGYDICSAARERCILTPIMFLSARILPEDKARGFDVGANQYLPKPFELEEFLARIRNMLKFQRMQGVKNTSENEKEDSDLPEEMRIGQAIVNFNAMEVRTAKKVIHLTYLEISLLKYFVRNASRLIPKEELLEKVWKMPGVTNTRAPDQFILRLRKMFEADPTHPKYFLTHRNAGYRFVPEEPLEKSEAEG